MPYVDPTTVSAPKQLWTLQTVLVNTGRGDGTQPGFSICRGLWEKQPAIGIRWNGQDDESGPGSPQSRGHATWFILPRELEDAAVRLAQRMNEGRSGIQCEVHRPDGYDPGAWTVRATLSEHLLKLHGREVAFPLPRVSGEMCRGDQGYTTVGSDEDGRSTTWGKFVEGLWMGHYYVYGLDSSTSDAESERIRQLIVEKITRHLVDNREANVVPRH